MKELARSGALAPVAAGGLGAIGVWVARENIDGAPVVVFVALAVAVACVAFRQRGPALAALGVGASAAFATPAGLGPLLVATGCVIAAQPSAIDARLSRWPELFDALIAVPAVAGLASVVAAQPSERGLAVGAGAGALAVVSWWRGPRHGEHEPDHETVVSYLGAVGAVLMAFAPELFEILGVLPDATITAGRGLAAGLAVFTITLVARQVGTLRTNGSPATAAHRR